MKSGPILAMVALILVGFWLVLQPALEQQRGPMAVRIGAVDLRVEQRAVAGAAGSGHEYRVTNRRDLRDRWMSGPEFEALVAREWEDWHARPFLSRTLMGFFNITDESWINFAWVALGLIGQGAFFGRMLVQWVISEKQQASVVPPMFWWLSLLGSLGLFAYFVWRIDFVGVLGQSTGIVIYIRNLRLIHKQKHRIGAEPEPGAAPPPPETPEPAKAGRDE